MSKKRQRTRQDLQRLLEEELQFLQSSADAFDRGFEGEAKRLAVTIRVLLHDTSQSHSLLGQLDMIPGEFIDTAFPDETGNVAPYNGLACVQVSPPSPPLYVAMLDGAFVNGKRPFEDWWKAAVFRDGSGKTLSRRGLVLTAANQDGGAHVDPGLDETYARLSADNSMGLMKFGPMGDEPMEGPERAAIRQIAHEVLVTLNPDYRCSRQPSSGMIVGNIQAFPGGGPPDDAITIPVVGRNERCPCGSGLKYKKCHGR